MIALRSAALLIALSTASMALAQTATRSAAPSAGIVPQPRQEKIFPLGATWVAVSLNGKPFTGDRPSFSLDQQFRAKGFAGCNTYAATAYPLREQNLAVGPFALTKKTCDKGLMASEQEFLVALRSGGKWDQEGSTLVIKSQSGELRFERAL
jgi:heat shock protein HslJ